MENIDDFLSGYEFVDSEEGIHAFLDGVVEKKLKQDYTAENLSACVSCMDYTTLKTTDTERSVREFIDSLHQKIRRVGVEPAAVCVFPNFVKSVRELLGDSPIRTASVAAGFPTAQTFPELKLQECMMAIGSGAQEIDVVLSVGGIMEQDYVRVYEELCAIRKVCKDVVLKVILEVGELPEPDMIYKASLVAMHAGADFIKTSTGKAKVNASPEAVVVMCTAIKDYFTKTGRKVGIKVAGGVSSAVTAIKYRTIVSMILGEEWLDTGFFRIGSSKLLDDIVNTLSTMR